MTTKTAFVLQNQHKQYMTKNSEWSAGKDTNILFKVNHHDEALNTLIEINAKDIFLRGLIIEVELDEKKLPVVEVFQEALDYEAGILPEVEDSDDSEITITIDDSTETPLMPEPEADEPEVQLSEEEIEAKINAMLEEQQKLLEQSGSNTE